MHQHRRMHSAAAIGFTTALALAPAAIAADLPQSGSFKLHSGWKGVGEIVQVEKNQVFGAGHFFTSYTGKIAVSGAHQITGGTGIQGKRAFQCTTLNDKGQYACTQQFDYSLTK